MALPPGPPEDPRLARTFDLLAAFAVEAAAAVPRRPRIEPTESDGELVRRARGGNRWAEEALYHRHVRPVMRTVMRLLGSRAEAEDAVQDTFVIALQELHKLRDEDAFGGWLLGIAVHQVHRRFRRRRLLRLLGLDRGESDLTLSEQIDPGAGPEIRALVAEIEAALAKVPDRARVAWILRHVEGHELRDVAQASGCSVATAKRLIARADQALTAHVHVERDGGGDA